MHNQAVMGTQTLDPELLLKRAYLAMRSRADALLAETGLTLPQAEVLTHLMDGSAACLRDLAARLGTQPATLKGILDCLERRGLIVRTGDMPDARIKRIQLTPEGEQLRGKVPAICSSVRARALRGFTPEAAKTFQRWLVQIVQNLDGTDAAVPPSASLWDSA